MNKKLPWKVHTPNLLKEIMNNPGSSILYNPIIIFRSLIEAVAQRAIELNDEKLNALMCMLTLYEQSDPSSKDYDDVEITKIIEGYTK